MHTHPTHLPTRYSLLLVFLASICANGCTEDKEDSQENKTSTPSSSQNTNKCSSNAMCATRLDGLTKCDLIKGVCVAPETETKTECTSDADCSSRTDDKTKCDTTSHQCVAPQSMVQECTNDTDCSSRTDSKTKCDMTSHQCVEPVPVDLECTSNFDCKIRMDGKTQCDMTLHQCVDPHNPKGYCGDDHMDIGEDCDGQDLAGKSCADWVEFIDGNLACNGSCHFDTSGCVQCTDENLSLCPNGHTCSNGHCVDPNHTVTCGDDLVEGDEQCDGTNLKGKSCADFDGFVTGELNCQSCTFDTSNCLECTKNEDCANRTDGKTTCTANVCTKSEVSGTPKVVISQIYTAGGNQGAIYNTKYIELFNSGTSDADISGWSLQYGTSNKNTISGSPCTLPKNVKLPRGGYYLVALHSGANGEELPTADHTCSLNPAADKGKLFLVDNSTALESSTPTEGYIDAIGYGSANWSEGNNPVASLSAKTAAIRMDNGCTDTDNNGNDFDVSEPTPRNSLSPVNLCSGSITPEKPSCGNGKLDSNEDCDGSLFVDNETSCSAWDSIYKSGSVSCNKCKIDYSKCSTSASECTEDQAECIEKDLSLKKCVNGKFVSEKCPYETPYCKTDAEGCSKFEYGDLCYPKTFVPHSGLHFSKESLYLCMVDEYTTNPTGTVYRTDCGSDGCMRAKRGYGVETEDAESCDTKGQERFVYFEGAYYCQKCKVNQNGALYWLFVPATYTKVGDNYYCHTWDDDIE